MTFTGIVEKGTGTGTRNGFPTANLPLTDETYSGIYAGTVLVDGREYEAAIYADQHRKLLESFILDFSADLYGKEITVTILTKIREDKTFNDIKELKRQIDEDVANVRSFFAKK